MSFSCRRSFGEWPASWDLVTQALKELHWLPIAQRIKYKLCLLVHTSLIGHIPVCICRLLTAVADVSSRSALRDATKGNLVVPRTRLKLDERAFSIAAPKAWNRFPTELKAYVQLHCSNVTWILSFSGLPTVINSSTTILNLFLFLCLRCCDCLWHCTASSFYL